MKESCYHLPLFAFDQAPGRLPGPSAPCPCAPVLSMFGLLGVSLPGSPFRPICVLPTGIGLYSLSSDLVILGDFSGALAGADNRGVDPYLSA